MSPNLRAFLDMVAYSELGPELLAESDNGYNVIVGSAPGRAVLFDDYSRHPNRLVSMKIKGRRVDSTAAGRYQILARYAEAYRMQLGLPDFGPDSQDRIAIQMIRECGALGDIEAGHFARALRRCASRWASLPGANYNQHENEPADLEAAYVRAGGALA